MVCLGLREKKDRVGRVASPGWRTRVPSAGVEVNFFLFWRFPAVFPFFCRFKVASTSRSLATRHIIFVN